MNHYAALAQEIAAAVKFLGSVPSSEARNQLTQARIFCLPSVTASNGDAEGFRPCSYRSASLRGADCHVRSRRSY
jgi:hypothetical protein